MASPMNAPRTSDEASMTEPAVVKPSPAVRSIPAMTPPIPMNRIDSPQAASIVSWYLGASFLPNVRPIRPPMIIAAASAAVPSPAIAISSGRILIHFPEGNAKRRGHPLLDMSRRKLCMSSLEMIVSGEAL